MKQKSHYGSRRQQGIALPIIMIILVLAALVTIYTTTTSVKEQQVTADQYRSEQAFSAAQGGVDHAVKRHNDYSAEYISGVLSPSGGDIKSDADITSGTYFAMGSYTVMFCDIWDEDDDEPDVDTDGDGVTSASLMAAFLTDTVACTYPIDSNNVGNTTDDATNHPDNHGFKDDARVGILSVGKPDDASGRRTISVVSAPARLLNSSDNPFPPLSARGSIAVTGSVAVINRYQHLNIWSGKEIDVGSAAVGTFIGDGTLNRDDYATGVSGDSEYRAAMTDTTMTPTLLHAILASNRDVGVNSDIVDSDYNIVGLTGDELFEGAFSANKDTVRDYAIAAGNGNIFNNTRDILGKSGLLWLESSSALSLNTGTVGTIDDPAFLVVNFTSEDLTFTISNESIHGLVFVFGNVIFLGSPVISGSVMATGSVGVEHSAAGGGTIVYDPESLAVDPEGLSGLRGIEPGTWKDWGYVN